MTPQHFSGQSQFQAKAAHLVLKQLADWLEQFKFHIPGQTSHIVVGFNQGGRIPIDRNAFDDIGIERSLGQEVYIPDLSDLTLENLYEGPADYLALALGIRDPFESLEKLPRSPDHTQIYLKISPEYLLDRFPFTFAQQTVVNEHAYQLVADSLVDEGRRHRGIHSTAEPENHPPILYFPAYFSNGIISVVRHRPVRLTPADFKQKIAVYIHSTFGVINFRMKL